VLFGRCAITSLEAHKRANRVQPLQGEVAANLGRPPCPFQKRLTPQHWSVEAWLCYRTFQSTGSTADVTSAVRPGRLLHTFDSALCLANITSLRSFALQPCVTTKPKKNKYSLGQDVTVASSTNTVLSTTIVLRDLRCRQGGYNGNWGVHRRWVYQN
jgi:hypothetical protein